MPTTVVPTIAFLTTTVTRTGVSVSSRDHCIVCIRFLLLTDTPVVGIGFPV